MAKNILPWINKRLGPTRSASNGQEVVALCPFCDDTKGHLYYNLAKNVWTCFRCDASGQGLDLIMQTDNVDAITAARWLSPSKVMPAEPVKTITDLPAWYSPLEPRPKHPKPGYEYIRDYAARRKFSTAQMEFYGLGYAVGDFKHRNRLMIPIERGYYQARAVFKDQLPKYINPDVPKGDRLFNFRFLGAKRIAICEGAISAIRASTPDCPALAVLGKKVLYEQSKRLADSKPDCVEIAFDYGTEKSDTTIEFAEYLHSRDIKVIIRSYAWGDPDECSDYASYIYSPTYKLTARLERLK